MANGSVVAPAAPAVWLAAAALGCEIGRAAAARRSTALSLRPISPSAAASHTKTCWPLGRAVVWTPDAGVAGCQ